MLFRFRMQAVYSVLRSSCGLLALAIALGVAGVRADEPLRLPETLFPELDSILQQMESESPDMLIQRAKVQAAEAGEHSRVAKKWPQVRLNLQITNRSEFRDGNPSYQNTTQPFGIGRVEQEIYHWGALDAWRDVGKFRKAIEENNYNETYRLLTLRVRSLYLRLLFAREQAGYYTAETERLRQDLTRSEQQAGSGRITADQLELERLAVEEAAIEMDRSADEVAMLEEDLCLATGWAGPILGVDGGLLQRLDTLEAVTAKAAGEAIATAAAPPSNDYLNKQQELNIEQADYVRIRSQNLPLLDIVAEAYQDQIATQGLDNVDRTVVAVYLRVNWHIFDGFETQWQKIQSKAKQRALEREAEHIAAQDKLEVERLRRDRSLLERDVRLWERRVAISENTLQRVQAEREKNTATAGDLFAARNELFADELTLASYRLDLLSNSAELLSVFGQDPYGAPKQPISKPLDEVYDETFYW